MRQTHIHIQDQGGDLSGRSRDRDSARMAVGPTEVADRGTWPISRNRLLLRAALDCGRMQRDVPFETPLLANRRAISADAPKRYAQIASAAEVGIPIDHRAVSRTARGSRHSSIHHRTTRDVPRVSKESDRAARVKNERFVRSWSILGNHFHESNVDFF